MSSIEKRLDAWLESIGLCGPDGPRWIAELRSSHESCHAVLSLVDSEEISLKICAQLGHLASGEFVDSAAACEYALGRFNSLYRAGRGGSEEWLASRTSYERATAQLEEKRRRYRVQVADILTGISPDSDIRASALQPLPNGCSQRVAQLIRTHADKLRRRHADGGAHQQPTLMAKELEKVGLTSAFHITTVSNLDSILSLALLPFAVAPVQGNRDDISDQDVQSRRARCLVSWAERSVPLHELVPFFYCMPTPMMWVVSHQTVVANSNPLCVLESTIADLADWCERLWITDRNAAAAIANFDDDPGSAQMLPVVVLKAERWNDVNDGKSLRSAELLCWPLVPPAAIRAIHVCDQRSQQLAIDRLSPRALSIPVHVTPEYFRL